MTTSTGPAGSAGRTPDLGPGEISEILRTFEQSGWTGMHLTVGGVTVTAGKTAPPPETRHAPAPPQAPPASAPAPDPGLAAAAGLPAPSAAQVIAETPDPVLTRSEEIDESGLIAVTAPTVGAFWAAPDPGSPPFVEIGSQVQAGDQLGIVEVMKLMNPVVSESAGVVVAIRARNAEMVEFGQPLFLLRPDD